jgi:hypothetical protein
MVNHESSPEVPSRFEDLASVIRRNRRSPEEVARLAEGVPPFSYEAWQRSAPPATPEELAETEAFRQERRQAREASLAAEIGISEPDPAPAGR